MRPAWESFGRQLPIRVEIFCETTMKPTVKSNCNFLTFCRDLKRLVEAGFVHFLSGEKIAKLRITIHTRSHNQ